MHKRSIIKIIVILILFFLSINFITKAYENYKIKHTPKIVKLKEKEVEVFKKIKLKDLIKSINGKLIDNPKIDTTKIGKKSIDFNYITDTKVKVPYTITINVVDKTPPVISYIKTHNTPKGTTKKELLESFFCGDNYDDNPKCTIEGDYSLNEIGEYNVVLKGRDSSNNVSTNPFILNVTEVLKRKSETVPNKVNNYIPKDTTDYQEIVKEYKNKKNKIGIDISYWQGKVNFKELKKSGVEFAYIRVGRGNGIGKEYIEDEKFKEYIEGFNKLKIPVGVYFYSNANSVEDARKEAKWVLSKIKKYKVDLEIVYDWEEWKYYHEYDLSFYHLTETAKAFINEVEKNGYKGMLYSSKYYLENIWLHTDSLIWLAHYTKETNYQGNYKVWQICENGIVKGIDNSTVDIDIRY